MIELFDELDATHIAVVERLAWAATHEECRTIGGFGHIHENRAEVVGRLTGVIGGYGKRKYVACWNVNVAGVTDWCPMVIPISSIEIGGDEDERREWESVSKEVAPTHLLCLDGEALSKLIDLGLADAASQPAFATLVEYNNKGVPVSSSVQGPIFNARLTIRGWALAKMRAFRALCKYAPPLELRRKLIVLFSAGLAVSATPITIYATIALMVVGCGALTAWYYAPSMFSCWKTLPPEEVNAINMRLMSGRQSLLKQFVAAAKNGKLKVYHQLPLDEFGRWHVGRKRMSGTYL